jgi:hypothetical protein
MDRDFLAIPATSAPVQCVFSQSNDPINKKRIRLLPESVRKIICLNQWSKSLNLKD